MREQFHHDLEHITDGLVEMTRMAGSAINRATQALLDADLQTAESVIESDSLVDAMAAEIDSQCFDLAARQQPVAVDLRVVMSGIRISMSLERMGDLAKHVAKQTRLRYPRSSIPYELRGTFAQMGALAEAVASATGLFIKTRDLGYMSKIGHYDDQMDGLHRELFTIVLSSSWPHGVEEAIDVTLLSRYYERYADHAVTVARRMAHIATGEPYEAITVESGPGQATVNPAPAPADES
jgi:phosphate transport system protein